MEDSSGSIFFQKENLAVLTELLGREPVFFDDREIRKHLKGKTVLITGGGGSIGGELCRQIAAATPGKLILFDIYENNAYEIEEEIRFKHPEVNIEVLIGSVRDTERLRQVFSRCKPEFVYHAAAHKHVPLMEQSPCEAIKNNIFGTLKTAAAAMENGVKKFVLISSDKAVNPTNVMGATKRITEMLIRVLNRSCTTGTYTKLNSITTGHGEPLFKIPPGNKIRTEFSAVRFGNVFNSSGSVVPLFRKQIACGGPITITHPEATRYFMTIPEAANLVLEASFHENSKSIFILDMGKPVNIETLAKKLISMNGTLTANELPVKYTGLRPGEKLHEELLCPGEILKNTENPRIHIAESPDFDEDKFLIQINELLKRANNESGNILELMKGIIAGVGK